MCENKDTCVRLVFTDGAEPLLVTAAWSLAANCMDLLLTETDTVHHLNGVEGSDESPLSICCSAGDIKCARMLLSSGACIHGRSEPLLCAAAHGHLSCVNELIKHGTSGHECACGVVCSSQSLRDTLRRKDSEGETALMRAVREKRELITNALLMAGAEICDEDSHGRNVLHIGADCSEEWWCAGRGGFACKVFEFPVVLFTNTNTSFSGKYQQCSLLGKNL